MGLRGIGAKGKNHKQVESLPVRPAGQSRADAVIAFIESLRITVGADAGKPFILRDWQKAIIRAWYAEDESGHRVVRTGLLTMGRKNGKTSLVAALGLCHLLGPEREARGQVVAAASDRDQSGLIFDELVAFIEDNPEFS